MIAYIYRTKKIIRMIRNATAVWSGSGKEGKGHLTTQSTVLNESQYSWSTRFADGIGTNPEELIAAAHAGCFTMKMSFVLGEAGFIADELKTNCKITLDNGVISKSELSLEAKIPGITPEKFQECAAEAKANCPVSKALNMEITLSASLV